MDEFTSTETESCYTTRTTSTSDTSGMLKVRTPLAVEINFQTPLPSPPPHPLPHCMDHKMQLGYCNWACKTWPCYLSHSHTHTLTHSHTHTLTLTPTHTLTLITGVQGDIETGEQRYTGGYLGVEGKQLPSLALDAAHQCVTMDTSQAQHLHVEFIIHLPQEDDLEGGREGGKKSTKNPPNS